MELKTIKGVVTAIRKDKKGIQVLDEWYTNKFKEDVTCSLGDTVEVTYFVKGQYKNFQTIKVIEYSEIPKKKDTILETRKYVDSGNLIKEAVQLVIADKYKTLTEASNDVYENFILIANKLEARNIGINEDGEYD